MTPQARLDSFLDRFSPPVARSTRRALAKMRKLAPGALELVYDNYNALAIALSPTERASDAIFSIAVYPKYPSLFFAQGASLPDPSKRLRGNGRLMRHIVLEDVATLEEPAVQDLVAVALARAKTPLDPKQRRRVVIKFVSPRQRPRRPALKG